MSKPAATRDDVKAFANLCVFVRAIYMHYKTIFENEFESSRSNIEIMKEYTPLLYGDLNRIFIEYILLQVCKLTDPATDHRGIQNLTISFLVKGTDFSNSPETKIKLENLSNKLKAFRDKHISVRNKLISHYDRDTILTCSKLGGADPELWNDFWLNLQEFVYIIYRYHFDESLYINGILVSDAEKLITLLGYVLRQPGNATS